MSYDVSSGRARAFAPSVFFFILGVLLAAVGTWYFMVQDVAQRRAEATRELKNVVAETKFELSILKADLETKEALLTSKDQEITRLAAERRNQAEQYEAQLRTAKDEQSQAAQKADESAKAAMNLLRQRPIPPPVGPTNAAARGAWEAIALKRGDFTNKLRAFKEEITANKSLSGQKRGELQSLAVALRSVHEFTEKPGEALRDISLFVRRMHEADLALAQRKPSFALRIAAIFSPDARQRLRNYYAARSRYETLREVDLFVQKRMGAVAAGLQPLKADLNRSLQSVEGMLAGKTEFRDDQTLEFIKMAERVAQVIERQFGA